MPCSCEETYQVLPAFVYCEKDGQGPGNEAHIVHVHYCIAGFFRGWKRSRISRFSVAIRESFIRECQY